MMHSKLIEDELVLERLTGEPRVLSLDINGVQTDVIVFCGIPLTYRLFLITVMSFSAGGSAFNKISEEPIFNSISKEIEAFWRDVGFKPKTANIIPDNQLVLTTTPDGPIDTHAVVTKLIELFYHTNKLSNFNDLLAKVNMEVMTRQNEYLLQLMDHQLAN